MKTRILNGKAKSAKPRDCSTVYSETCKIKPKLNRENTNYLNFNLEEQLDRYTIIHSKTLTENSHDLTFFHTFHQQNEV